MSRYFVFLSNFNYYIDANFASLEFALTAGQMRGFECSVVESLTGKHPFKAPANSLRHVASWHPISGAWRSTNS